jgi:hypothetical protein
LRANSCAAHAHSVPYACSTTTPSGRLPASESDVQNTNNIFRCACPKSQTSGRRQAKTVHDVGHARRDAMRPLCLRQQLLLVAR